MRNATLYKRGVRACQSASNASGLPRLASPTNCASERLRLTGLLLLSGVREFVQKGIFVPPFESELRSVGVDHFGDKHLKFTRVVHPKMEALYFPLEEGGLVPLSCKFIRGFRVDRVHTRQRRKSVPHRRFRKGRGAHLTAGVNAEE